MSAAVNLLDATSLLSSFGTLGIALVLCAATGLAAARRSIVDSRSNGRRLRAGQDDPNIDRYLLPAVAVVVVVSLLPVVVAALRSRRAARS